MICDNVAKAQVLLGNVERQETAGLQRIILMDLFDAALVERGQACSVQIQALRDVEVQRAVCSAPLFTALHLSLTLF